MSNLAPKLIYQAQTERGPHRRRSIFLVLALIGVALIYRIFAYLTDQQNTDFELAELVAANENALIAGQILALIMFGLLLIRFIFSIRAWLTLHNERVRVFNQGLIWEKNGSLDRYSWDKVRLYRRGARVWTLFNRPIITLGANSILMSDKRIYKFTGRLGDPRQFDRAVSPVIRDMTGQRMGAALRAGKSVKLGSRLIVAPSGIVAGKHKLSWKVVDIELRGSRLYLRRVEADGRFKPVTSIPIRYIDNLVGFMDVAESIIQNYQPHRFNIHTKI